MILSKKSAIKVLAVALVLVGAYGFLGHAKIIPAQDDQMAVLKEQLKSSMRDIVTIATGLADYCTDNGFAPSQDGAYELGDDFYQKISPFYVKVLPVKDPWGGKYVVYCGLACNGKYGIKGCDKLDFVVVCLGRDGKKDDWKWDESNTQGGLFKVQSLADFDKDLVMWNGSWVRAPAPK
jgi:hypothetical protein